MADNFAETLLERLGDETTEAVVTPVETPNNKEVVENKENIVVDTPTTPVIPNTPVTPVFDESNYIQTISGNKFKTADEIKAAIERLSELDETKNKLSDYEQQLQARQSYIEPADDYIKGLNDFVKKGGDRKVFEKINSFDIDKMSNVEAKKIELQLKHPELSSEQIDRKLEKQYLVSRHNDTDIDQDVEDAKIDLTIDGTEAKKYISQYKANVSIPDAEKQRQAQNTANTQRIEQWQPVISTMTNDFKEISVNLDGEGANSFQYKLNSEEQKSLSKFLGAIIQNPVFINTPENIAAVKSVMIDKFKADNFDKLVSLSAEHARQITSDKWRKKVHNPSILKDDVIITPTPENSRKEVVSAIFG